MLRWWAEQHPGLAQLLGFNSMPGLDALTTAGFASTLATSVCCHLLPCRQMDDHVRRVVAALVQLAGPGGPHERTLLLVSGDHGQTLGGDHGGGSPEEVDSVLVAVDAKALRDAQQAQQAQQAPEGSGTTGAAAALAALAGPGGSKLGVPAACRSNCSCGVERNQCAPDLPQMDLTPTLAALLGLPTPFGNLGKLSAELWQLAAPHLPAAGAGEAGGKHGLRAAWEDSLAAALLANVRQVHTYLHTYAGTPGASFSRAALAQLDELAAAAQAAAGGVKERVARQVLQTGCWRRGLSRNAMWRLEHVRSASQQPTHSCHVLVQKLCVPGGSSRCGTGAVDAVWRRVHGCRAGPVCRRPGVACRGSVWPHCWWQHQH